jgi:hypothetical protein
VVEDVVFHEFRHQAVDRTTGSGEAVKNLGALLVAVQSLEHRLELPDDFLGSIYQEGATLAYMEMKPQEPEPPGSNYLELRDRRA